MRLRRLSDGGGTVTIPASGDQYWDNVSLLLNFDGSFTDASSTPKTVTRYGNAALSYDRARYGCASANFANGGYLLVDDDPALDLNAGDFCIEFWAYLNNASSSYSFVAKNGDDDWSTGWGFEGDSSEFFFAIADSFIAGSANPTGQWFHVAVARTSGTVELYRNGTRIATGTASGSSSNAYPVTIGSRNISGQGGYSARTVNGNIEDLRITKGSNRGYTGASIAVPRDKLTYTAPQTLTVVFS